MSSGFLYRFLTLFTVVLGLTASPAQSDMSEAQSLVFDTPHLENITEPTVLRYVFKQSGPMRSKLQDVFEDRILVTIDRVRDSGTKDLSFEFLSGQRRRPYADIVDVRGNPIVILFLNHDIWGQSRVLGGTPNYFRNRIRGALNTDHRIEDISVEGPNGTLKARKVIIKPYRGDKNRARFKEHVNKVYEIVVAPDIPGGIFSIRSYIPALDTSTSGIDAPHAMQHLRFDRVLPAGEVQ